MDGWRSERVSVCVNRLGKLTARLIFENSGPCRICRQKSHLPCMDGRV